jgi:hypothetical protein
MIHNELPPHPPLIQDPEMDAEEDADSHLELQQSDQDFIQQNPLVLFVPNTIAMEFIVNMHTESQPSPLISTTVSRMSRICPIFQIPQHRQLLSWD